MGRPQGRPSLDGLPTGAYNCYSEIGVIFGSGRPDHSNR
jgi:hypothetical protein